MNNFQPRRKKANILNLIKDILKKPTAYNVTVKYILPSLRLRLGIRQECALSSHNSNYNRSPSQSDKARKRYL